MTTVRPARVPLVSLMLCACILALGSLLALQLWHGSQRAALLAIPAKPLHVIEQRFHVPVQVDSGELQAQAVFHPSRSFYVVPAPVQQQRVPPDYRLAGVMRAPNQPAAAILINNQTKARTRVQTGEVLEDWLVEEIQPGKVLMMLDSRRIEITAKSSMPGASAASPSSAAVTNQAAPGLTVVPKGQPEHTGQSVVSVPLATRVLSAPGGSMVAPATAGGPESGARLYRPPPP